MSTPKQVSSARKSPLDWSAVQTTTAGEVLEVCDSLGISPTELQSKRVTDFHSLRVANEARFRHYEELRKAKAEIVQREMERRQMLRSSQSNRSPKRAVPKLPLSGVGLWRQKFNYACSRIETVRRVLENQSKLQSKARESAEGQLRTASVRDRKVMQERETMKAEAKARAQARQLHREKVLGKRNKVTVTVGARSPRALSPDPFLYKCAFLL